ncbi:MAG: glycosyltransferase family 39 protein [Acidobacteriia bacterium]|nr:glycosyltransferase family 39 protein [Terriglobia bacterium]
MKRGLERWQILLAAIVIIAGAILRFRLALINYLNPDEALHVLLSYGTWRDALRNSVGVTHPPLLIMINHAISLFVRSELAFRFVPVAAGILFPIVLAVWLRKIAGTVAALTVLLVLTLAPHLVTISAEVRSYTLAFLFVSLALLTLEVALDHDDWKKIALFSVFLCAAIVSDYSVASFAAGAGIYAIVRLRRSSQTVRIVWIAGQAAALALYGVLYWAQVRLLQGRESTTAGGGWLRGAFPQGAERLLLLVFPFAGTLKQFAYLMASIPLGVAAVAIFAVAIFRLWKWRAGVDQLKSRPIALLLTVPFAVAFLLACASLFPYGRSRHTLVLGVMIAIGLGIFVGNLPSRISTPLLWGLLVVTPLWLWKADFDPQEIAPDRYRKQLVLDCVDYMRREIPPGSLIFTEQETLLILAYYTEVEHLGLSPPGQFSQVKLDGRWRVAFRDYKYLTPETYGAALRDTRLRYGLGERDPVWVLDGGWDTPSRAADPARPFTKAIRIFRDGAGPL